MGVEPSIKMIAELLKHTPLSKCTIDSGWSNKDILTIYPKKKNPKTFQENYESLKQQMDPSKQTSQLNVQ